MSNLKVALTPFLAISFAPGTVCGDAEVNDTEVGRVQFNVAYFSKYAMYARGKSYDTAPSRSN